jgi:hypothetical protein
MQKKMNFIVTDPQQYKVTCKVCNQEFTAVEYELFKEGVKLNITVDGKKFVYFIINNLKHYPFIELRIMQKTSHKKSLIFCFLIKIRNVRLLLIGTMFVLSILKFI